MQNICQKSLENPLRPETKKSNMLTILARSPFGKHFISSAQFENKIRASPCRKLTCAPTRVFFIFNVT